MKKKYQLITAFTFALSLSSCSDLSHEQRAAVGAGIGAVAGGVIGHQFNGHSGRYVGAALGALAGGAIGYYMDTQQEKLEKALSSSGITVTRMNESTIRLNIPNSITFATNQHNLNPNIYNSLSQIAAILNQYDKTIIQVFGFADSTGTDQYNLELSQKRSDTTKGFFINQNVLPNRIISKGYGEAYPIASNNTESGRAMNRRVEIYIKAIEKGNEQSAYQSIY